MSFFFASLFPPSLKSHNGPLRHPYLRNLTDAMKPLSHHSREAVIAEDMMHNVCGCAFVIASVSDYGRTAEIREKSYGSFFQIGYLHISHYYLPSDFRTASRCDEIPSS
jgi:hypothetical protein